MKPHAILSPALTLTALAVLATLCPPARAAEHITLRNGFEYDCLHHVLTGDRVRLYLIPSATAAKAASEDDSYIEVPVANILRVETVPDPPAPPASLLSSRNVAQESASKTSTPADIPQLLAHAGAQHNIDTDLLASVVQAESAGNPRAISRAGARGLMQLMPATASTLGVHDSFAPDQNISGGTTYLDQLLTRYHDDIRLAVAAYNAGPAAVDRYHGIPPFAETRAYVARVVREFNRRKLAALPSHPASHTTIAAN
jgi:soluble lytic murein transglycosylase-like protein